MPLGIVLAGVATLSTLAALVSGVEPGAVVRGVILFGEDPGLSPSRGCTPR